MTEKKKNLSDFTPFEFSSAHKMKIGIVEENKKLRKWYEAHGFIHTHAEKFDFFPFTCGYMEREL